jgi:hypothetical protein
MAEDPNPNETARENARRQLERDHEATERTRQEARERLRGKPTPTQEENDRFALGDHVTEKEDDGSGPDYAQRVLEAQRPGGGYQTRETRALPRREPAKSPGSTT